MKVNSNFLLCFGVIQEVLGKIEISQNVMVIQVLCPALQCRVKYLYYALIAAHSSSIGNRNVALFNNAER